jgi:hypothetical protein
MLDGCLIASKARAPFAGSATLQPTAVEAMECSIGGRAFGIPPNEASRVDR